MEPCQTVTVQESNSGDCGISKDSEIKSPPDPDGEAAPLKTADNIKDLSIDVNSADDVRQAFKAITERTVQANYNEDDSTVNPDKLRLTNPLNMKFVQITEADLPQRPELPLRIIKKRRSNARPKGGPRKKRKRQTYNEREEIERMYIGKLSNVVPFKENLRCRIASESDSDIDSILYNSS